MIKEPTMKIKKKSKSREKFNEMSDKKAELNGNDQNKTLKLNDLDISEEHSKKHKKSKKEKHATEESEKPFKKAKIDEKIITKTSLLSQNSDVPQLSKNTAIAKPNDLKKVMRGVPKESLITRLRNTSSHIEHSFSLLHIPRHKNAGPNDSEDDEGKFNL